MPKPRPAVAQLATLCLPHCCGPFLPVRSFLETYYIDEEDRPAEAPKPAFEIQDSCLPAWYALPTPSSCWTAPVGLWLSLTGWRCFLRPPGAAHLACCTRVPWPQPLRGTPTIAACAVCGCRALKKKEAEKAAKAAQEAAAAASGH